MTTDVFTPAERSAVMRTVKSRDTGPELRVRRMLRGLGFRYRLYRRDLPGAPDLAFVGRRLAVFVHGCFWHGHDCPRGARVPKTRTDYWTGKVARTRVRDAANLAKLEAMGWCSVVIWECELRDEPGVRARLNAALGDQSVREPAKPRQGPLAIPA